VIKVKGDEDADKNNRKIRGKKRGVKSDGGTEGITTTTENESIKCSVLCKREKKA